MSAVQTWDPADLATVLGVDLSVFETPGDEVMPDVEKPTQQATGGGSEPVEVDPGRLYGMLRKVRVAKPGKGNTALRDMARLAAALGADEAFKVELREVYARRDNAKRSFRQRESTGKKTVESGWNYGVRNRDSILRQIEEESARNVDVEVVGEVAGERPGANVFVDLAAVFAGGLTAPKPDAGMPRSDGAQIFYYGKNNALVGDPETAKTLFALANQGYELAQGRHAVFIDTDYNGPEFVIRFLMALGVHMETIFEKFHYSQPGDREELEAAVAATCEMDPCIVVLDSVGENLGLWKVGPNDDPGFIEMNRETTAKLAGAGHAVITIDHMAKNSESRRYGATGTTAKKRVVDGALYEVKTITQFSPTRGGQSKLMLKKDRNGGVRALDVNTDEEAAVFTLNGPDPQRGGLQEYRLEPGRKRKDNKKGHRADSTTESTGTVEIEASTDVLQLLKLDPAPTSKVDVMTRMKWGNNRALTALREYREMTEGEDK